MPGAACAREIVAIALPRPLEKLPCMVRDPDGGCRVLLLEQLGGDVFLAHPGGKAGQTDATITPSTSFAW